MARKRSSPGKVEIANAPQSGHGDIRRGPDSYGQNHSAKKTRNGAIPATFLALDAFLKSSADVKFDA